MPPCSSGWRRLLSYVAGDYRDQNVFHTLRQALGQSRRPLYYLAIPPSMFGTVASGLAASGCNAGARVVVEKPFGRDLHSARELNATLRQWFAEDDIFRIDHYLGKEPVQNLLYFRFANAFLEPVWNHQYVGSRGDHDGGEIRRRRPRAVLRRNRRAARRGAEPLAANSRARRDGAAG